MFNQSGTFQQPSQASDAPTTRRVSATPWILAVGMVLLALLSVSCVESTSHDRAAATEDGSQDFQAPDQTWSPGSTKGSEWSIDDVESAACASVAGLSPALGMATRTVVDFFSPATFDAPGIVASSQEHPSQLTVTTQAHAAPSAVPAAAPSVLVVESTPTLPRLGTVGKSRPVPLSKMTDSQVAAYLDSLKICQPPFARSNTTVVQQASPKPSPSTSTTPSPGFQTAWTRGGARPFGSGDESPLTPTVDTTPDVVVDANPTVQSPKPATAIAMTPVHIPTMRPIWAGLLGIGLGLAAFGAAILTAGLAYVHSRTLDRAGNARRSLTLRTRLTLSFGAMATLGLAACALGAGLMVANVSGAVQIAACAVVSIAAPIGLWLWLSGAIVAPIARASEAVNSIASGDLLRSPLNSISRDECGELCRGIDRLAATLRDALTEVAISTSAVSGAAGQIASGTQQMSDTVGCVARKCSDAAASAAEASRVVGEGRGAISKSAADIRRVDADACLQSEGARSIQARAERVGKLVELIEDLADRSHLVALNASVEASRAGAASGPFGQLAEEARRVAERAQNAVAEASRTVESLDADAQSVGDRAEQSALNARHGAALAATATEDLERIAGRTGDVAGVTRSAAAAAEEAGADAAQSAAIAAQLSSRTSDIMAVVGRFKLGTEKLIRQAPSGTVAVPANRS